MSSGSGEGVSEGAVAEAVSEAALSRDDPLLIHVPLMKKAEDWKRWVLLPHFDSKWRRLGLDDDDLSALQISVMMNPKGPPVVRGTGGLRKCRFAKLKSGRGKSGSFRIGYAYFEAHGVIVAIAIYAKKDKADIPPDKREEIRKLIERLEQWIASGN